MSRTLVVRPNAEEDLRKAFGWYEAQEAGLGVAFLEHVEAAFERIQERPLQATVLYRGVRRVLVSRFPYGVFYVVTDDKVRVLAVCHQSQDPLVWKRRR